MGEVGNKKTFKKRSYLDGFYPVQLDKFRFQSEFITYNCAASGILPAERRYPRQVSL